MSDLEEARKTFLMMRAGLVRRIEELRKMPENERITLKPEDLIEFMQNIIDLGDIATEDP